METTRLGRGMWANPAMYKAAADDICTALERAVQVKDKPNAVHTNRDFCRGVVNGALYNKNVAGVARAGRDRSDASAAASAAAEGGGDGEGRGRARKGRAPSGEWFRKRSEDVEVDDVLVAMGAHMDGVCKYLKELGLLDEEIDACIDKMGIKRWDSKPGPELVRGAIRGDRGAYAEVYIIMHCVVAGRRLVLGFLPLTTEDDNYKCVAALIRACQERGIRLGTVMKDREFFDTRVILAEEAAGVTYLMPCPDTAYVRRAKKEFLAGERGRVSKGVITRDRNTSAEYALIMAEKKKIDPEKDREPEDRIIAFCTNDPDIDVEKYASRWGGETGNRQFKMSRPRTRATKQGPRVLYFAAALMLYNAWVVINGRLYAEMQMRIKNSPPLIELDSVLGMLVDVLTGPAQGPGPPPPPPPPSPPARGWPDSGLLRACALRAAAPRSSRLGPSRSPRVAAARTARRRPGARTLVAFHLAPGRPWPARRIFAPVLGRRPRTRGLTGRSAVPSFASRARSAGAGAGPCMRPANVHVR